MERVKMTWTIGSNKVSELFLWNCLKNWCGNNGSWRAKRRMVTRKTRQDETPEVYEEMKGFYRFCLRLDCSCIILYKNSRHLLSNFINYTFYFVLWDLEVLSSLVWYLLTSEEFFHRWLFKDLFKRVRKSGWSEMTKIHSRFANGLFLRKWLKEQDD